MSAFEDYLQLGLALTPLRPGTKEPYLKGWQLPENAIRGVANAYRLNESAGLLLAHCDPPLMTLDIDDFHAAASWFDEREVDLADLLQAEDAVQIVSGRPNHFKLLYRIDRPRLTRKFMQDGKTIFELRCATGNGGSVQDVLPPSIHPSTGKPYEWGGLGNPLDSPSAPEEILELWDNLNEDKRPQGVETDSAGTSSLDAIIDQTRIKEALQKIPPDIDYPDWLAVGQGINNTLPGERGFALWDTWSAKGEKYKPGECEKKWLTFTPGGGITKATVFDLAQKNGWRDFHGSTPGGSSFTASTQFKAVEKAEDVVNPPIQAMRSRRIADMESKPIDWIWPDMLAGGKLHLIAGKGGRGKTTLLLNIAATVSKGGTFPCGHAAPQGRVLILSGEDGAEDTILPRLKLAEADSERCEILDPLLGEAFFEVREHLQALEQTIVDRTDVRLLIFDPITAFIGDAENNSPTVVRSVLARLSMMAERTGIAVACISHMRKGKDGEVDERVLGSGAWVHACRIVLGVTETDEHGLILGKLKTNISPREGVFPFELEPIDHPICKTIMRVRWGSPLPYKRYEEFKEVAALERGSKIAEAVDFLTRHLSSGPVSYIFLDEQRKNAGITEPTLNRAAKELGVIKTRQKEIHASTMWVLPDNFQKHSFHVLRSTD